MKRAIIAGNWKMNNTNKSTIKLIEEIKPLIQDATNCEVVICVPYTDILTARKTIRASKIKLGAQNVHWDDKGAYTGEISAAMLKELKVQYVLIGHSERRQYFGETDEIVNKKVKKALEYSLKPIICIGETLEEREKKKTTEVVRRQLTEALKGVDHRDLKRCVIAYEPVWAIGTGRTATAEDANRTIYLIRKRARKLYGRTAGNALRIQYGGSMNASNAQELMEMPHVDGGLIGGASLKAQDFAKIVVAANSVDKKLTKND